MGLLLLGVGGVAVWVVEVGVGLVAVVVVVVVVAVVGLCGAVFFGLFVGGKGGLAVLFLGMIGWD